MALSGAPGGDLYICWFTSFSLAVTSWDFVPYIEGSLTLQRHFIWDIWYTKTNPGWEQVRTTYKHKSWKLNQNSEFWQKKKDIF